MVALVLAACSKYSSLDSTAEIDARSQSKHTFPDCSNLKAKLLKMKSQRGFELNARRYPEQEVAYLSPDPDEVRSLTWLKYQASTIKPDESLEDFNKRKKEEIEAAKKMEEEKQALIKTKNDKIDADFEKLKDILTDELNTCVENSE